MKKKIFTLFAVIAVMMSMFAITGCDNKSNANSIANAMTVGVEDGELKYVRLHNYGANNFDSAVEWRKYRIQQGDAVSDIELINGTYWFTAGRIAG